MGAFWQPTLAVEVDRNSRLKGFPNVAEHSDVLTVRGAKAWTTDGMRAVTPEQLWRCLRDAG